MIAITYEVKETVYGFTVYECCHSTIRDNYLYKIAIATCYKYEDALLISKLLSSHSQTKVEA